MDFLTMLVGYSRAGGGRAVNIQIFAIRTLCETVSMR